MGDRVDGTGIAETLIRQMNEGRNWVERRDAATALAMMVREALLALRKTAADKDPDVAHECQKSIETIGNELKIDLSTVEMELSGSLRAYHMDRGGPGALREGSEEEREAEAEITRPTGAPSAVDVVEFMKEIARKRSGRVGSAGNHWYVELDLEGGRRQKIFVDPNKKDGAGEPIVILYTLCGPAEPKVYSTALKSNSQLSHAAFGLLKQGEKDVLALISRRRLSVMTENALEDDLLYLASKGDRAEKQLQGGDEF